MSAKPASEILARPKGPKFEGEKVKLANLENQTITVLDYVELESKIPTQKGSKYVLVSIKNSAGMPCVFSTSSKVIMDNLSKLKQYLPRTATVKHTQSKSGPYSYWELQ